ncbi:MAG TPA: type III-B CRISPR module RAMP protein Cmr4 [Acidobacteriota bacterium]|nr:type III-B CRISPR module RAMP protein Cmr4 [Acidobacteriota bacterium]
METRLLHILTRTPLHVGAGSSVGAIDMPVQRERHTQIPIIPGSSLKGVMRDLWPAGSREQNDLFGPESTALEHYAGSLLVGEGRVLCFPVRSAQGSFAWLTSPLTLQRYARERGEKIALPSFDTDEECLSAKGVCINGKDVVLEEYRFSAKGAPGDDVMAMLADFIPDDLLTATITDRLVIVSDGIFSHFCANACEIQQRICIDEATGTVKKGGLFNQENVPSETLFFAVMSERNNNSSLDKLAEKLDAMKGILQIGGDETIGLGFCSVALKQGGRL